MENVSVTIQDWPTKLQLANSRIQRGLLLGLYEGFPRTKGAAYKLKLPDKITIFKIPLLMISRNRKEMAERVRSTVLHEIAHHFGMDEAQVRQAESSRYIKKRSSKTET